MEYLPVQDFSIKWNISKRRIQILCNKGRIEGAKTIGNMWVIPQDAVRPSDARIKNPVIELTYATSNVRKDLKRLLKNIFKISGDAGIKEADQKAYVLAAIAGGLCFYYLDGKENKDSIFTIIFRDISGNKPLIAMNTAIMKLVSDFIDLYKEDWEIHNILSWSYQYANKITNNNMFSQTQFFTEKYMISYLVEHIHTISEAEKIVDPCTGGGNFLVECLDYLCSEIKGHHMLHEIVQNADRLFGYDIDQDITNIAVVNIRLRALSLLKRANINFDFKIWDSIRPHIFKPRESDNVEGALAAANNLVVDVISNECMGIHEAIGNADIVLTNPPFATVKGMSQEQKDFLKRYYPDSNCDTCVCFLDAIYKMLKPDGICGIVSQNSWMHLKSFYTIRKRLTSQYTIYNIVNLGSGAFLDLSGEKSNVALLIVGKKFEENHEINVLDLTSYALKDKIKIIQSEQGTIKIFQQNIDGPNGYDFTEKGTLKSIGLSRELYKDIAIPMQGTSTGNSKELVGYFWEHFGDEAWISVSNGGGYCRWQGLNDRVVKWGKDGKYIKDQKGSALRNVKYFQETNMVFSDTGTAGLNVRILLPDQIFIASGPGIRILKGNEYAHLALLNSRLSAYYVKIISPKLTIAAGYIGQIPVKETIYSSVVLEKNARLCVELKSRILSARPNNPEYDASFIENLPQDLNQAAWSLFNEDITNEVLKMQLESKIDRYIFKEYGVSEEDILHIDKTVGPCAYWIKGANDIDLLKLDNYLDKILDASCSLKRTRTSKNALGSDGLIEFSAKDLNINPEILVKKIQENPFVMKKTLHKYKELLIHNAVLSYLEYNPKNGIRDKHNRINDISAFLTKRFGKTTGYEEWMNDAFNGIHKEIFKGIPYLTYEDGEVHKYDHSIKN